jgi:hypothetical protein
MQKTEYQSKAPAGHSSELLFEIDNAYIYNASEFHFNEIVEL